MLVADSFGLAAVVGPDGSVLWSVDAGPDANPHAAELLPDGRVAVAASTGGWVRIYAGLLAPHERRSAQFDLPGAHGVLWDPERELLWALGAGHICALAPGDARAPAQLGHLTANELPSPGGHDLQPIPADADLLWVTTSSEVYQYSKSRRTWSTAYPDADLVNRPDVKSIATNPDTGEVLQTVPAPGADPDWVTDTIDIFAGGRRQVRPQADIYKARYWVAGYR